MQSCWLGGVKLWFGLRKGNPLERVSCIREPSCEAPEAASVTPPFSRRREKELLAHGNASYSVTLAVTARRYRTYSPRTRIANVSSGKPRLQGLRKEFYWINF